VPALKKTSRKRIFLLVMVALCALACGVFYHYITSGGLTARQKPSAFESLVAQTLVDFSIPKTVKALKNPLSDSTDPSIGRDLYQRNSRTRLSGVTFTKEIARSATATMATEKLPREPACILLR
jgi:hypothetical protein